MKLQVSVRTCALTAILVLHQMTSGFAEPPSYIAEKLTEALQVLDSTSEASKRRAVTRTLLSGASASAFLGANGEMILLDPNSSNPIYAPVTLLVVPDKKSLRLLTVLDLPELGMHFGDTIAKVNSNGSVERSSTVKSNSKLTLFPQKWPLKDGGNEVLLPSTQMLLAADSNMVVPKSSKPANATDWLLLEWHGYLVAPSPDMERPSNVLWVIRERGGLKFVHSGPLHQGVYMTIASDRSVEFGKGAVNLVSASDQSYWWPFVKNGLVISVPPGLQGRPAPQKGVFSVWDGDQFVGLTNQEPRRF